jgi:hypothetical protein
VNSPGPSLTRLVICLLGFFATGFSQPPAPPAGPKLNTREAIDGSDTVRGYRLSPDARTVFDPSGQVVMGLPMVKGMPGLMGMLERGSDIELFVTVHGGVLGAPINSLEIFRGRKGAEAVLVHAFTLEGPWGGVRFFQQPDARANPEVFLEVYLGSIYGQLSGRSGSQIDRETIRFQRL